MSVAKETITIERLGKYGPMVNGSWLSLSSKSGLQPTDFSPGATYDVMIYTSDSGKKYINQIVGTAEKAGDNKGLTLKAIEVEPINSHTVKVKESKKTDPYSPERQKQIQAQGVVQAAVQCPWIQMFATNYDEAVILVEKLAKFQLKFIQENS